MLKRSRAWATGSRLADPMLWLSLIFLTAALLVIWRQGKRLAALRETHESLVRRLKAEHQMELAQGLASSDAVIQSMEEGLLQLDANGRVMHANAAMRSLFKLDDSAKGRTVMEAMRIHQVQDIVQRTFQEGRVLEAEIEMTELGGPVRCFQVNSARIPDATGGGRGAVLVFHDISRLKLLEQTRREFVANVSHELRTPLSIIKGYAETLTTVPVDAAMTQKFASIMERHADRLTALVDDLLTISGLESGQMRMNVLPVELHKVVQRVVDELEEKASFKDVELVNDVPGGMAVPADSGRLQQVLTNLIDNAIKYGREHGRVMIAASLSGDEVLISVNDDGAGIPKEARERVFERFYRVDKARSRDQGGTGLGLSIVKHIVQAHGGRVWVEASEMGGARFCLTLPLKRNC